VELVDNNCCAWTCIEENGFADGNVRKVLTEFSTSAYCNVAMNRAGVLLVKEYKEMKSLFRQGVRCDNTKRSIRRRGDSK
jgi:hypothetical protein